MNMTLKIVPHDGAYYRIVGDSSLIHLIWDKFRVRKHNYQFNPLYKSGRWDGYIPFINLRSGTFGKGLLKELIQYANMNEIEVDTKGITDHNEKFTTAEVGELMTSLQLTRAYKNGFEDIISHDYQLEAIKEAVNNRRCVLEAATSAGKSLIMYGFTRWYQAHSMRRTLIIVPRTALVEQLKSDFKEYSLKNGWDAESNVHGLYAGKDKDSKKDIVVSTWQSLKNFKQDWYDKHQFGCVIVDEAHGSKSSEIQKVLSKLTTTEFRIGLTGTVPTLQDERYTILSMLGPVIKIVETHELIESGKAAKVEVMCCVLQHTPENCLIYNPPRRVLSGKEEYDLERRFALTECESRHKFVVKLCLQLQGNSLVLANNLATLDRLEKTFKEQYPEKKVFRIDGSTDVMDREDIRSAVNKSEMNCILLGSVQILSTGCNIPRLHNLVFATPSKSDTMVRQSIGRVIRLADDKVVARVFDIVDDMTIVSKRGTKKHNYLYEHYLERIAIYSRVQLPFKVMKIQLKD